MSKDIKEEVNKKLCKQQLSENMIVVQKQYNFNIPIYILEEVIKKDYDKVNLCYLINLAVINSRFTKEEGNILKKEYCYK